MVESLTEKHKKLDEHREKVLSSEIKAIEWVDGVENLLSTLESSKKALLSPLSVADKGIYLNIVVKPIVADLRLVLVTPEKTLFDRPVASIRVPMFDGSAGVYPGRAPLVGRLGIGELKLNGTDGQSESYFVDGGFIQIKGEQVSVLTNSAQPVGKISKADAAKELADARAEKATSDEEMEALSRKLERARKLVSMASVE